MERINPNLETSVDQILDDKLKRIHQTQEIQDPYLSLIEFEDLDLLGLYLHQLNAPPLTLKEEEYYCNIKDNGIEAQNILNNLNGNCPNEYKSSLENDIIRGKKAIDIFVLSNLGLVIKHVKKYPYFAWLDLIQEGNKGLIRAAQKFDFRKGIYSTYASHWAISKITRGYEEIHSQIILTPRMENLINTYKKNFRNNGAEVEDSKIAEKMGIPINTLQQVRAAIRLTRTIVVDTLDHKDNPYHKYLPDHSTNTEEEALNNVSAEEIINLMKLNLPEIQQNIVIRRLGLLGFNEHSFQEIGESLNLTPKNAQYHFTQAMNKMHNLRHKIYRS